MCTSAEASGAAQLELSQLSYSTLELVFELRCRAVPIEIPHGLQPLLASSGGEDSGRMVRLSSWEFIIRNLIETHSGAHATILAVLDCRALVMRPVEGMPKSNKAYHQQRQPP